MVISTLKSDRAIFKPGAVLPRISTMLDSVRAYQFEVRFDGLPPTVKGYQGQLTAAAKVVGPIAGSVDDIVVDRLNDKVFYPGKYTPENVTITFDNQLLSKTTPSLWEWFKSIYDPIKGDIMNQAPPGNPAGLGFKAQKMTIYELDNTNAPTAFIQLYGVYPQGVRFSEKNYSTNEFSTLEVTFRYDFVDYKAFGGKNSLGSEAGETILSGPEV